MEDQLLLTYENQYWKDNPNYFLELLELVKNHKCHYGKMITMNKDSRYKDRSYLKWWIEKSLPLLQDNKFELKTKIYWILNGIVDFNDSRCHCKFCNSTFDNVDSLTKGYNGYCSRYCQGNSEEFKTSIKQTKKKRYGNEKFTNISAIQKTKLLRYGNKNFLNHSKAENTKRLKYGDPNYNNREKTIKTLREKYGVDSYLQLPLVRAKTLSKESMEKAQNTKRKNGTFNTSKLEREAYWMLKFIFPKLQTQYKSDAYPFVADFYDPEQQNVRFEFQGSWTHGRHPFNKSNKDDVALADKWKSKKTKYYSIANAVWTQRDPQKREIAKKNGIQLIEFWNLEEVRKFVIDFSVRNLNCGSKQIQTII